MLFSTPHGITRKSNRREEDCEGWRGGGRGRAQYNKTSPFVRAGVVVAVVTPRRFYCTVSVYGVGISRPIKTAVSFTSDFVTAQLDKIANNN